MDPHSQNESMTNMMNGQVYERLTSRDKQLGIVPGLGTEWTQVSPLVWRLKMRQNVKFHDGSPLTADDVVYSIERGQQPTSQINNYASAVGTPKKIDDYTVEFDLPAVNPIFLQHLDALWIMSKSWSEKNRVTKPLDFKNKEESYTSLHANGTGPYMLVSRAPGHQDGLQAQPDYWGKIEGNVQDIVFTPIANDATRLAALVSGELDFVLDPAPRDVPRLSNTPGREGHRRAGEPDRLHRHGPGPRRAAVQQREGQEPLQGRARAQGALPGDRHRDAEVEAHERAELPDRRHDAVAARRLQRPRAREAPSLRPGAAKKLLADAGYPDGFEVQLDCPNNRYINDEQICIALAGMWAQSKVKVRVVAQPRATYFPKLEKYDYQHVHARLGRLGHRRRDHAHAGDAQQRGREGHRLLQLRPLAQRQVRRARGAIEHRARPQEARGAGQGGAARVEGERAHAPAAPPGDPVGGARPT